MITSEYFEIAFKYLQEIFEWIELGYSRDQRLERSIIITLEIVDYNNYNKVL